MRGAYPWAQVSSPYGWAIAEQDAHLSWPDPKTCELTRPIISLAEEIEANRLAELAQPTKPNKQKKGKRTHILVRGHIDTIEESKTGDPPSDHTLQKPPSPLPTTTPTLPLPSLSNPQNYHNTPSHLALITPSHTSPHPDNGECLEVPLRGESDFDDSAEFSEEMEEVVGESPEIELAHIREEDID